MKGTLVREEITEMKKLTIDPQIKSVHSGYQDMKIGILNIQQKLPSSDHLTYFESKTYGKKTPLFKGVFKDQCKH